MTGKTARYTLISHHLCPYVQRVAIVLLEKGLIFERIDIDLHAKPDWFPSLSPLGKTPVLLVNDQPIFESAVICEFLDDSVLPRLHPAEALARARHRAWMEFGSALLNTIGAFYSAKDEAGLEQKAAEIHRKFQQLEETLPAGPYFDGARFSIVDAVFGPVFRYLDVFDEIDEFGFTAALPNVQAWRAALQRRESVRNAVSPDYNSALRTFLLRRESALSNRMMRMTESARE